MSQVPMPGLTALVAAVLALLAVILGSVLRALVAPRSLVVACLICVPLTMFLVVWFVASL